jgi:Fic family protein
MPIYHLRAGETERLEPLGPPLALLPHLLPPDRLSFQDVPGFDVLIESTSASVAALNTLGQQLDNPDLLQYLYIRKEAVLSSQIEGSNSTLSDLLAHENHAAKGYPTQDLQEVSNYVAALYEGVAAIQAGARVTLPLLNKMHATLMAGTRGGDLLPGVVRTTQNWIGPKQLGPDRARFVPPQPQHLPALLANWLDFMARSDLPLARLIKAALAHYQFETIHPYLDGNGRLGRLSIILHLMQEGVLSGPYLYVSYHFKQQQQEYYNHLQAVREDGAFEAWVDFFFEAIFSAAEDAGKLAHAILKLTNAHQRQIIEHGGKRAATLTRIYELLKKSVIVSPNRIIEQTGLTGPTVYAALEELTQLGFITETTGLQRNRQYVYKPLLELLQ